MSRKKKDTSPDQRTFKVVCSSMEQKSRWADAIKKSNAGSASRFFREIIESQLSGDYRLKGEYELQQENLDLKQKLQAYARENASLKKENADLLQDKLEMQKQLFKSKYGSWSNSDFNGELNINIELVELFKKKSNDSMKIVEIIELLGLDSDDSEIKNIVERQIDNLIDFGLVTKWRGGFKWK